MPTEHLDSSKEMSKYDTLALWGHYIQTDYIIIVLFAHMSNLLLQYGLCMM